MREELIEVGKNKVRIYKMNTVIVGTGAAGYNAALRLHEMGQKDIAIITEGKNMGTSRNTGSDKQTYYKVSLSGSAKDSPREMAETLFSGGSMDGDIALVEASLSAQSFFHLLEIGVNFPHNEYGEYVGYKTDHDPYERATSVGPLTSNVMTKCLENRVMDKQINILDGFQVIKILKDKNGEKAVGLIVLDIAKSIYVLINCTNIIYATGGPAGMYETSVYPESQTGATGTALLAGMKGKNLTESQFGIASTKFRWNLSGTYQQVIPRYVSTNQNGEDEKEFLNEYFNNPSDLLEAIFLKGYQWPFDPKKIENYGSSLVDVLVYTEKTLKNRRVFLDFTKNPEISLKNGSFDFSLLKEESWNYLNNSKAFLETPIERLEHMNKLAIDLYLNNGIDLKKEYLEIAVCAQHNNGGLSGDCWWESNIKNIFPIGESNGTHGVYRPGGSALNSGQVGGLRAAQYIYNNYNEEPLNTEDFKDCFQEEYLKLLKFKEKLLNNDSEESNTVAIREKIGKIMSRSASIVRKKLDVKIALEEITEMLRNFELEAKISSDRELFLLHQNYDLLNCAYAYLSAIESYIDNNGTSRGSYLIYDSEGKKPFANYPEELRFKLEEDNLKNNIQEVELLNGETKINFREVREIPVANVWFENVWSKYRKKEVYRKI